MAADAGRLEGAPRPSAPPIARCGDARVRPVDRALGLDEFKARLPLVAVVGRWVKLTRQGREWRGLCPFHNEKTPSFHVVEDKGFYHCFGCGAHGTAIDFVMAVENLGFAEALERLADLTGIPAPRREQQQGARRDGRERLLAAAAAARDWFTDRLWGKGGATARAYLERRGIEAETARTFGLGYAPPERTALKSALLAAGYTPAELAAAGLVTTPEDGGEGWDRFRERLIFPIDDARGRVVGFGGRALGEARAKYLNSPDGELFHKGELLYNHARAGTAAREAGTLVLAEGYMDVLALWRAGLRHAVAPLGTAVTERQLMLLWRHSEAPIVCLDGDSAGVRAALRLANMALPLMQAGRTLRFVRLPAGEDPDSLLASHGPAALLEVLGKAMSLSAMVWSISTERGDFTTPESRSGLLRSLKEFARRASDWDLKRELEDSFRRQFDERFPRWQPRGKTPQPRSSAATGKGVGPALLAASMPDPAWSRQARLLAWILRHPEWLDEDEEELASLELDEPALEQLRQEILVWQSDADALDAFALATHLTRYGFGPLIERVRSTVETVPFLSEGDGVSKRDLWRASLSLFVRTRKRRMGDAESEAGRGGGNETFPIPANARR